MDGDRTKLIIEKAERKDSALFTCTAINDYGEDAMNIQLTVQGGCSFADITRRSLNGTVLRELLGI